MATAMQMTATNPLTSRFEVHVRGCPTFTDISVRPSSLLVLWVW